MPLSYFKATSNNFRENRKENQSAYIYDPSLLSNIYKYVVISTAYNIEINPTVLSLHFLYLLPPGTDKICNLRGPIVFLLMHLQFDYRFFSGNFISETKAHRNLQVTTLKKFS